MTAPEPTPTAEHIEEPPAFLFIVQEKEPPYLVSVCELDDDSRAAGAEPNATARALFLECMTTGEWPAYAPRVHPVTIPRYSYSPRVKWCERLDGFGCDLNGEDFHGHWYAVKPGPGTAWTLIREAQR